MRTLKAVKILLHEHNVYTPHVFISPHVLKVTSFLRPIHTSHGMGHITVSHTQLPTFCPSIHIQSVSASLWGICGSSPV